MSQNSALPRARAMAASLMKSSRFAAGTGTARRSPGRLLRSDASGGLGTRGIVMSEGALDRRVAAVAMRPTATTTAAAARMNRRWNMVPSPAGRPRPCGLVVEGVETYRGPAAALHRGVVAETLRHAVLELVAQTLCAVGERFALQPEALREQLSAIDPGAPVVPVVLQNQLAPVRRQDPQTFIQTSQTPCLADP